MVEMKMKKISLVALFVVLSACGESEPNESEIKTFLKTVDCKKVNELDEHPTLVKRAIQHCNSIKARESRYKKSEGKEW